MGRLWSRRWFRIAACSLGVVLLFLACVVWYFRISGPWSLFAYTQMSKECHPVWKDLAWRRISSGHDLKELVSAHPPSRIYRHADYTTVKYYKGYDPREPGQYYTGITIAAKKGRLIHALASSCTWQHTFFNKFSRRDKVEYYRSRTLYKESVYKEALRKQGMAGDHE